MSEKKPTFEEIAAGKWYINGKEWNPIRVEDRDNFHPDDSIIMWLDDERPMPGGYTHHVKTADQAIELLKTGKVITCSLDHDLGSDYNGTGYDVAKWIEEQAHAGTLAKVRCRVHSHNPAGAKNMKLALQSAYRAWGT